jgi:ABC-type dipeptide/oligopeptide/nickel transport system ATPase component
MNAAVRTFSAEIAVRKAVGLIIGLVGPSSSGKTYSALRIASGIREVTGGEIDFIDTETGRALYYADKFRFNHVKLTEPFSPLDYLAALEYCVKRGTKTIVIDSMSHEHDGKGGVLDWHERECERLIALWSKNGKTVTRDTVQLAAWKTPKDARTELINTMLQMNVNLVMTYRAKEKIKIVTGRPPIDLGWQPIAGEQYIYEMVLQALLPPNSEGVPIWTSTNPNEQAIMKRPEQFRSIFDPNKPKQLDEETGRLLAQWAAGTAAMPTDAPGFLRRYTECASQQDFDDLEKARGAIWKSIPTAEKPRVKDAAEAAKARLTPVERVNMDQATVLADSLKEEGVELTLLLAKFEINAIEDMPAARYDEAKAFISDTSAG